MSRVGGIGGTAAAPRRSRSAGGGFALPVGEGDARPRQAAAALAVAPLLAMQEEAGRARRRPDDAERRADAMLAALGALQLALLRGGGDRTELERLAAVASDGAAQAAPGLRPLMAEILLRARVELARWRAAERGAIPPRLPHPGADPLQSCEKAPRSATCR